MNTDVAPLVRKLIFKIVLFQAALLPVLTVMSVLTTSHFKQRLATHITDTARESLLAGDTRRAIFELQKPVLSDFTGAVWEQKGSTQKFSIPQHLKVPDLLFHGFVSASLFFDEAESQNAGELKFYYNRWGSIFWAVLVWLVIVALSFPIGYREKNRLIREYQLLFDLQKKESFEHVSAQVAHDIRSPLTALDAALKNAAQMPEEQRIILRHAVNRIRDIANNLLEKNRQQSKAASNADSIMGIRSTAIEPPAVCLLSSLVDPVVTEKRLQFESKPGINIDFELTAASYGLFAKIQPVEFKRLVSNLVNNAVEVLGDKGVVNVGLAHEGEKIILAVADNGKGISPEILAKLGQRGETHGKTGGSGLGLFHARTTAEGWGGSLGITSELGKGTTVTIKLPVAEPPAWFVSKLELPSGKTVVVLDDDESIHQVWRGRFESARVKEHGIEVYHFSEPDKLRGWVKNNPGTAESAVYLFDYELLGYKETGLSLAEELDLGGKTILVTSRYEEKRIIEGCERFKIRMIPKGLAGLVPITAASSVQRIANSEEIEKKTIDSTPASGVEVLLDDDALVHMTWKMSARNNGITLKAFKAPVEFLSSLEAFPKDTPIYLDSELGEGLKGEDIAKDLWEKGFTGIYLETGHPPERFSHLPWLKVIGKEPPWGNNSY